MRYRLRGVCLCVCVGTKAVQLKTKLQRSGNLSPAARLPLHFRFRPAVFYSPYRLVALSVPEGKIFRPFQE